jgi:hypothetical protein
MAANQTYSEYFNIQECPRALTVARSFRWYRLKSVRYIYTPEYNVFQEGVGNTKPYMFRVMNRTGDNALLTVNQMESMGAVPIPFTKTIKFSYKPNLIQAVQLGGSRTNDATLPIGAQPLFHKWLATKWNYTPSQPNPPAFNTQGIPNCPNYFGHQYNIRAGNAAAILGNTEVHLVWEFKEPQMPATNTLPT